MIRPFLFIDKQKRKLSIHELVQSICYTTLIKQFNKQLVHEWLTRDLQVKMNSNDIRSKFGISF
jgi:hypothetical protein